MSSRHLNTLALADLSNLPRAGAKGAGTAQWLAALGLPTPAQPNSWLPLPNGGLIARLGLTEYLVDGNAALVGSMLQAQPAPAVYPVLRQDASYTLSGPRVNELLLQTCNVDFRVLEADPSKVILTSMAGVSVTILAIKTGPEPVFRLWFDGTYAHYMWETLSGIAAELGGGIVAEETH